MVFQKKNLFQKNQKTITNTIQATDFTYILYFKVSISQGIQPKYITKS